MYIVLYAVGNMYTYMKWFRLPRSPLVDNHDERAGLKHGAPILTW